MAKGDVNEVFYAKLCSFSEINEQFLLGFKLTERNAALSRHNKNELHAHYIATKILTQPQYFDQVTQHFSEFIPKILCDAISDDKSKRFNHDRHARNSILLGKVATKRPDLESYAHKYFEENPPPFMETRSEDNGKRRKGDSVSDLELVESCYSLLKSNPYFYKDKWDWSLFIQKYFNGSKKSEVQWIAMRCIAIISGMNETQLRRLIVTKISQVDHEKFTVNYGLRGTLAASPKEPTIDPNPVVTIEKKQREHVINISGIYIPKCQDSCVSREQNDLVLVPSTGDNLKKVALGLTSCGNHAICLQGPVGSGKTSLVEYLAWKTGRKLGDNFIKVQLGDQTDSKMLLGTYRCTDVPGEFIWQPGVVTQAVIDGHWLLLEDIDSASMDVASVLSSLLENGTLTVPGYRDSITMAPGFQLFFTQRLMSTITGHQHKKHSNAMTLLAKHVLQVTVDPLTCSELKTIVVTRHAEFATIADRMLSVFQLFTRPEDDSIVVIPRTSRLISTRDFFKWCRRAALDFDIKSQASALKVLQDAIDVFCCSYPQIGDAMNLAKEISTHLGIINQKAEYFFKNYKPTMALNVEDLVVGRAKVARIEGVATKPTTNFYFTRPSSVLLERVMCCVTLNEPVLLVGETGTGKTSTVQYLAKAIGQKLIVINMNQQSDSADLLGGFKPVDMKFVIAPVKREFEHLFGDFFKVEPNRKFLGHVAYCYNEARWSDLVKLMMRSQEAALNRATGHTLTKWRQLGEKLHKLSLQLKQKSALAFAFIEGSLAKAVQQGHWVLLDEINLASAETLECLSGLLEGSGGSLSLLERGDRKPIERHSNFTLFACMNPSTDVGKRDLPPGLRNRFTEFFVDELTEKSDLVLLVSNYLQAMSMNERDLGKIVDFYLKVRREAEVSLSDDLGHKPHFSLRSLCRALMITARNPCGMFKKSLYEAFCLSFLTQLDAMSYRCVQTMIGKYLIGDERALNAVLKQPIPEPIDHGHVQFEGYWVKKGALECCTPEDYILTESVRRNLRDLVRIVSIGHLPVLLQGDTSVGKTSLITYLAKSSGNKCVRINNHEHTDLQEYVGSYAADASGKLVFREGLLVEAMRKGHWIILDELNLAPTDVLEALNRVLDDNRELFIPETQQTVKADPNFMLFATQNPPGSYGGRKMLSRAFRNRFVELHFNSIPPLELEIILQKRCQMAPSYAKKMISVMSDLQVRRRGSAAFAGKQGFITLRDLFRWGERYRLASHDGALYDWDQHLADEGYLVLAGRVRKDEEKREIAEVLQKNLKRKVDPQHLFTLSENTSPVTRDILEKLDKNSYKFPNIVWTYTMRQLAVLTAKAFQFKEPVLLVGETGGGKTTVCKLIAEMNTQDLATVNCHMHTESSDFIGGLRPVRDRASRDDEEDNVNRLFEWVDGPLIEAMVKGSIFLADEISLADDSVLERLNSLLEPERTLLLAEKGVDINDSSNSELVVAHSSFYFIGTMNPGGDFGKKELSPALRNRFTEIWCESCTNRQDLVAIIEQNVLSGIGFGNQEDGTSGIGARIMNFVEWFKGSEIGKRLTVSIRDILTWVTFINTCADKIPVSEAYLHGAYLTFLDGLGSGITGSENVRSLEVFVDDCKKFLTEQGGNESFSVLSKKLCHDVEKEKFGIEPFFIEFGDDPCEKYSFSFEAPTTIYNTLVLLRGMQLNKAILLEGSPGVGKTSLVTALAKCSRHKIFRVNLSDQTDISDLFGADLPVEGGTGGQFSWRDGPLLQALKLGHWILLDELNLASQSVLEGLNACLDHRGEIFIPELGKVFHVKCGTRFFACQNPQKQGGSRRGLPQSFLNRFIQVHVKSLTGDDLSWILKRQFAEIPAGILDKMIEFNERIVDQLAGHGFGNRGSPWEFNLRDLTRWCEAMIYHHHNQLGEGALRKYSPERFVWLIYSNRMRTSGDKDKMAEVFSEVFGFAVAGNSPLFYSRQDKVFIGDVSLDKSCSVDLAAFDWRKSSLVLREQLPILRSLAYCVNLNWMALLVGSSAAGKSAVVHLLANLLGKTLRTLPVTSAMDTTDLLGGFEQTDYTRHLEAMAKETRRILFKMVRSQLLAGSDPVRLLQLWENYTNADELDSKNTMEEETKLFLRKLDKLSTIWPELPPSQTLDDLKTKSQAIRHIVKTEGSLSAGGKFEWVDSVLIKCLQDGSWLLIDNVNLCSAAVLDRLNALLEPNGVLTVGERGVDAHGRMVEVRPHRDFRLFLTMDPKNGEISRAMRNRGVEICMLGDNSDRADVKSLMARGGLTKLAHINALLYLHDFVSDLMLGERPNVNDLLRAAVLISQQIVNGSSEFHAFFTTVVEVYYKGRSREFKCQNFDEVLREELEACLKRNDPTFWDEDMTLKTENLAIASDYPQIVQQGACLRYYLETRPLLSKFLLIHYYSITSQVDLSLRHRYMSESSLNNYGHVLNGFVEEFRSVVTDYPEDCHWFPELDYKGRDKCVSNLLILGLHFVADLKHETGVTATLGNKIVTLHEYMRRRDLNKVDDQFDDNTLINNFLKLISQYDKCLLQVILSRHVRLSDQQLVTIQQLISWRFILIRATVINVKNIRAEQRNLIVANLAVHYQWFVKYSVAALNRIVTTPLGGELEIIVKEINKSLDNQFSTIHKVSKRYQKCIEKPPPRTSEAQLEFETLYQEICHKLQMLTQDSELRQALILAKIDSSDPFEKIGTLKSIADKVMNLQHRATDDLSQFIDIFAKLHVRQVLLHGEGIIPSLVTIPCHLATSFTLYQSDSRFKYELYESFFHYLLAGEPLMTHHLAIMTSDVTRYGKFRQVAQQHASLSLTLWRNMQQLPSHDRLTSEVTFLTYFYREFLLLLGRSLSVPNADHLSTNDLAFACQINLRSNGTSELFDAFLHRFSNAVQIHANALHNVNLNFDERASTVAGLHMELSYVMIILNSRLPPIDPSAKKTLKKKYCAEHIANFEELRLSYELLSEVYGGGDKNAIHAHHAPLDDVIGELRARNEKLETYNAVRPKDARYQDIVKTINHAFATVFKPSHINSMFLNIKTSINDLLRANSPITDSQSSRCSTTLKTSESSLASYESLYREWSKFAPSYPDVIQPLLANLTQFMYGLKSSVQLLRRLHEINRTAQGLDVQGRLVTLIRIPGPGADLRSYDVLIDSYMDRTWHDYIRRTLCEGGDREILRLCKCGIQESFNNCALDGRLTSTLRKDVFFHFANLVGTFVELWKRQEEEREARQREADSLYKTKTKCDDPTEEEQIEEELRLLFPNYHDRDFSDMQKPSLESSPNSQDDANIISLDSHKLIITREDVRFVADLHMSLLQSHTKTEWLNPSPRQQTTCTPDFVFPLVEKYELFKRICDKAIYCLDYRMDNEIMESVSVMLAFVRNYGDASNLVGEQSDAGGVGRQDFYKSSNVEEVKSSFHVLEELRVRVVELLDEWPDQPTLKTILTIIERVRSFDLTSPLSRFLTGFELLLSKCHEWEEVAHSGVSLGQFAQNLTHQIIAWRKIELSAWKDLLNATFERLNEPVSKWWLYLYDVMEQFTTTGGIAEVQLIETLQDYVTRSSLAEFQGRLSLLYAFHCHAVYLPRNEKSSSFVSILWNLYSYFQQFLPVVVNKIKDLRTPIEKKLKDYVKIVRWKDINYWAIKETVDKSHKALHKYVREFQDALKQPVKQFLINTTSGETVQGIWDRPKRGATQTPDYTTDPSQYIVQNRKKISSTTYKQLMIKSDALFNEARDLTRDCVGGARYPKLLQTLDSFVGDVIERSGHLQRLEVDTTLSKEKQRSHAKSILQQKHRALADLFKSLSTIGVSYKSGMVEARLKMAAEEFLMRPVNLAVSFSHMGRKDDKILTIWDQCEKYYLKSLMRADVLDTALKTPAQDLGLPNITRCRGFSSNLLTFAQRQKTNLSHSALLFYYIRHYTTQMTRLCEGKEFLATGTVTRAQSLMKNITIVGIQCGMFVNSSPEQSFDGSDCMTETITLKPEPVNFIKFKDDEVCTRVTGLFTRLKKTAARIALDLEKSKGEVPSYDFEVVPLDYVPVGDLSSYIQKLTDMEGIINDLIEHFGQLNLCENLKWVKSEVNALRLEFTSTTPTTDQSDEYSAKSIRKLADTLAGEVHKIIETVSEKHSLIEDPEDELKDEHLRELIVKELEKDSELLNMPRILKLCHKIARQLFRFPPHALDGPKIIIGCILPLLEQLISFYHYFLTQQVLSYRLIGKMSSVLINVFIELVSKGFCIPPELAEGQESGDGKAPGGLGLGEGQGERDVSDKIESEDQLDDAQPAGQGKEQKEDNDCKEEEKGIEMSEDFDSTLQDIEKGDNSDEDDDKSDNSDADEQMGETEKGAEKQNEQNFGSDDEEAASGDEAEKEQDEEKGEGGVEESEKEFSAKDDQKSKDQQEEEADKDEQERQKEQKRKEINEMEEPEVDEDQTDPYHGKQPELPEPEPMDLPDDLQLDEGEANDNEQDNNEENPFDIDTMKENNPPPEPDDGDDETQKDDPEKERDDQNDYSSEDEDVTKKDSGEQDDLENEDEPAGKKEEEETPKDAADQQDDQEMSNNEETAYDQTETNQDDVEAMDADNAQATDKTEPNQAQNQPQKSSQSIQNLCQDDKPDQDGVGQSQMEESSTGHTAQTTTPQDLKDTKKPPKDDEQQQKKRQKPGDSDIQRTLGDVNEPVKKKLKTTDAKNEEEGADDDETETKDDSEMYEHIKEAKSEVKSTQVLDVATKEQAETQKDLKVMNEEESEDTPRVEEDQEEDIKDDESKVQKPDQLQNKSDKKNDSNKNKKQHPDGDILEEMQQEIDVEGELVETLRPQRGNDSTYHTLYQNLREMTASRLTFDEINTLRTEVEQQLSNWNETPSDVEAEHTWQKITSVTSSLAQDLSEQLRLVLEPTQASRLRGDFRTGRRINMRKVIPYIASQFRKDKIWLRRTKPSKREYQIVLAIDDSSSMADNRSKELAFESVALISKALTLLESGELAVVSFGETAKVLHKLCDQFSERSGVKLLQQFKFDQNKTCVAKLVDFVGEMLVQSPTHSSALNAKLLVVVSDGRGVFSEGESVVRQAVRRAKLANIFMVFVIIDNPENKSSILDIRMPCFKDGKLTGIENYMDVFPFSFYIILRDINSLPNVLSDALRQWFEVVSNLDKQ